MIIKSVCCSEARDHGKVVMHTTVGACDQPKQIQRKIQVETSVEVLLMVVQ
jgi:hypothetical protein